MLADRPQTPNCLNRNSLPIARNTAPLIVNLFAAEAVAHDFCCGEKGSFDQRLGVLTSAARQGRKAAVHTLLTRPGFRLLGKLPGLIHQHRATAWIVTVPRSPDACESSIPDPWIPRLGLAIPHALHAVRQARQLGIAAYIRAAPSCALGPFAKWTEPTAERSYAAFCGNCAARATCPGVDASYLERFGDGELRPMQHAPQVGTGTTLGQLLAEENDVLPLGPSPSRVLESTTQGKPCRKRAMSR